MHTIGVLPRSSMGWRHRQGKTAAREGATPFRFGRDFEAMYSASQPLEFAYTFDLSTAATQSSKTFLLHIDSAAPELTARLNGQPVALRSLDAKEAKHQGWHWEAMLAATGAQAPPMLPGEAAPQPLLRSGPQLETSIAPFTYSRLLQQDLAPSRPGRSESASRN